MPMGIMYRAPVPTGNGTSRQLQSISNSKNVTYVKKRNYKNKKRAVVDKSFKLAYNKLLPSKELKAELNDTAGATNTMVNRMNFTALDTIAQGTQLNQRLGASIYMSYVHLNGTCQSDSTTKNRYMRIMIIQEKSRDDLDTITFANLYKASTTYANLAPAGLQHDIRAPINREFYNVFFDKKYKLPREAEGALLFNERVRIGRTQHYPLATQTAVPNGGRFFIISNFAEGDNAVSNSTAIIIALNVKTYFKDYRKIA